MSLQTPKFSISIVTYKNPHIEISNLIENLYSENSNIYIVDNSPTNELQVNLPNKPNIHYIYNNENIGYGRAHNIAINESIKYNANYHIVLNPDIEVEYNQIEHLINYMDSNPTVGLCMPNIVYPTLERQHLCKLLPRPTDLIFRRFIPTKSLKKRHDIKFELQSANYDKSFYAPSLSGCFMFMRTDILKKIGGFDERFFMYCEDIDLCRRINQHSQTMYVPTKPVIHHYNKESYRSTKVLLYHIKSAIQYFNKWGWVFDKERKIINKKTLEQLKM